MTGLMFLFRAASVATVGNNDGRDRQRRNPARRRGRGQALPGADPASSLPSEGVEASLGSLTHGLYSGLHVMQKRNPGMGMKNPTGKLRRVFLA